MKVDDNSIDWKQFKEWDLFLYSANTIDMKESRKLLLGTWQGLYLFEHRINMQHRKIIHHFVGD